jgi:hypothetical protein
MCIYKHNGGWLNSKTSKLSFTASSKASLVLSTLKAAFGYCLSFSWWDELWAVKVSLSFPQVRNEYAASAEE